MSVRQSQRTQDFLSLLDTELNCAPDTALGRVAQIEAEKLLHGHLQATTEPHGWVRPWRFTKFQLRSLASVGAWHPGLFRQMARTTAGISLEFTTDAELVVLEVGLDTEPSGTAASLELVDGTEREAHDGISCDFDDEHLGPVLPNKLNLDPGLSTTEKAQALSSFVSFELSSTKNTSVSSNSDTQAQLPGMSTPHHVRIWLPYLRGCTIRRLFVAGSIIEPVPTRETLLALGDSITQGFVADDPAQSFTALLGDQLGMDVINQGIGGQVFQTGSLADLAEHINPEHIVVAYGANYRYEDYPIDVAARTIRAYLEELSVRWPGVPTWVVTPFGARRGPYELAEHSIYDSLVDVLSDAAALHPQMRICIGTGLLPARKRFLADGFEHPNQDGHAHIAERLMTLMQRSGHALRKRANPSARQYARDKETGRFVRSETSPAELEFVADEAKVESGKTKLEASEPQFEAGKTKFVADNLEIAASETNKENPN